MSFAMNREIDPDTAARFRHDMEQRIRDRDRDRRRRECRRLLKYSVSLCCAFAAVVGLVYLVMSQQPHNQQTEPHNTDGWALPTYETPYQLNLFFANVLNKTIEQIAFYILSFAGGLLTQSDIADLERHVSPMPVFPRNFTTMHSFYNDSLNDPFCNSRIDLMRATDFANDTVLESFIIDYFNVISERIVKTCSENINNYGGKLDVVIPASAGIVICLLLPIYCLYYRAYRQPQAAGDFTVRTTVKSKSIFPRIWPWSRRPQANNDSTEAGSRAMTPSVSSKGAHARAPNEDSYLLADGRDNELAW